MLKIFYNCVVILMKMYEYQAKKIFAEYNLPIPKGQIAETPKEAENIAEEIGSAVTLKAQVLTGGRGKAGGIKFASSPAEARQKAEKLLSLTIKDFSVNQLLVEEKLGIEEEFYVSLTVDRQVKRPVLMLSLEGGVDIEEVAEETPEKIIKYCLEPGGIIEGYRARELAAELGIASKNLTGLSSVIRKLNRLFQEKDAHTAEINPLALTADGFYAADAKLIIDEDALFRQGDFSSQEEDLPYVELDGTVGCIVNGAGLAMSTMDTLMHLGGEPANFLDIGGGATAETMSRALEKVAGQTGVNVIFINILGGITRCDEIARGILESIENVEIPVVVRLRGTNESKGTKLLQENDIEVETDMKAATQKAIAVDEE